MNSAVLKDDVPTFLKLLVNCEHQRHGGVVKATSMQKPCQRLVRQGQMALTSFSLQLLTFSQHRLSQSPKSAQAHAQSLACALHMVTA